jgi:hypothetical protein
MALKAILPLAIGLGAALASRFLSPNRRNKEQAPKQDFSASEIGQPYPWVYGITTVGEFVVYKSKVRGSNKGKQQQKGKGSGAFVSAIIGISRGEIGRVTKIIANNKIIWANTPYLTRDYLTNNCDRWAVYNGSSSQPIDPVTVSAFGANATAYRGLAYFVVEDLNVKDFGDELPQFRFEVERYLSDPPFDQFNPVVGSELFTIPIPPNATVNAPPGAPIPNGVNPWNTIPDIYFLNGSSAAVAPNTPAPGTPSTSIPTNKNNVNVEFTGDPGQSNLVDVVLLANYPRSINAGSIDVQSFLGISYNTGFLTHVNAILPGLSVRPVLRQNGNFWEGEPVGTTQQVAWDQPPLTPPYALYFSIISANNEYIMRPLSPGAPDFYEVFEPAAPFDIGHHVTFTPTGTEPYWNPSPTSVRVQLPTDYVPGGRGQGNFGLLDYPPDQLVFRSQERTTRYSPWYGGYSAAMSVRVVQKKDGTTNVLEVPTSLAGVPIFGAYIETQTTPVTNLAGSTPDQNEGRVVLWTANGAIPLTPYSQDYGDWHHYGAQVSPGVFEYAEPIGISPELQLIYSGDGEKEVRLEVILPPPFSPSINYFEAPFRTGLEKDVNRQNGQYARAIPLGEIARAMANDFPESAEFLVPLLGGINGNPAGLNREIYGLQVPDSMQVWSELVKLYNLFDIEITDYGSGLVTTVDPSESELVEIPSDWIVRNTNDSTGDLTHSFEVKTVSFADVPSEVRISFRDIGRDGENSVAFQKNPALAGVNNTQQLSTNASMAYVTCKALAKRHLAKAISRQYEYSLTLSREAFGRFTIGDRLRLRLPNIRTNPNGWVFEDVVILIVESIDIDENFVSKVTGVLGDSVRQLTPIPPLPPITLIQDNLPTSLDVEAVNLQLPLLGEPTNQLESYSYGRTTSGLDTTGRFPGYKNEFNGMTETQVSLNATVVGNPNFSMTWINPPGGSPTPGVRYRDGLITILMGADFSYGLQSYTEFQFQQGLGNYLIFNGLIIRAREAFFNPTAGFWQARDFIAGLVGTYSNTLASTHVLVPGQTYDTEVDTPADLNVLRSIRIHHPLQLPSSSPLVVNTQAGFTARPHQPTNLRQHRQPGDVTYLTWHGHVIGQGNRINGRHPLGISSQSYRVTIIFTGAPSPPPAIVSVAEFTFSRPPGAVAYQIQIRQLGDLGQESDPAIINGTY